MAHFIGSVRGGKAAVSRLGHKTTGLTTRACSWSGAVEVRLYHSNGVDMAAVTLTQHQGAGSYRTLYDGPVSG